MKKCPYRFTLPKSQQECIKHDCEFYTHLQGMNPQTGQPMDQFGCAVSWLPVLMVENAGEARKVAAEINKHTNVFVQALPPPAANRVMEKYGQNGNALPSVK